MGTSVGERERAERRLLENDVTVCSQMLTQLSCRKIYENYESFSCLRLNLERLKATPHSISGSTCSGRRLMIHHELMAHANVKSMHTHTYMADYFIVKIWNKFHQNSSHNMKSLCLEFKYPLSTWYRNTSYEEMWLNQYFFFFYTMMKVMMAQYESVR